jgi:hypothetical protein
MTNLYVIGVNLAKSVIQVSVLSPSNRELLNSALSHSKFHVFLGRRTPGLVASEACATSPRQSGYAWFVVLIHDSELKEIPGAGTGPE